MCKAEVESTSSLEVDASDMAELQRQEAKLHQRLREVRQRLRKTRRAYEQLQAEVVANQTTACLPPLLLFDFHGKEVHCSGSARFRCSVVELVEDEGVTEEIVILDVLRVYPL